MSTGFSFRDTEGHNPHTGNRSIPDDGDYSVMISKADLGDNKSRTGLNLALEYTILAGEYSGSVLKEWLSVVNNNETAQNIARSKAEAIRRVTKLSQDSDIDALVGKNMIVRVKKEPNEYVDNNGNKRTGYNAVPVMYMDLNRTNAEGKPVAQFVAVAKQDNPPPAQSQQSSGSNKSATSMKADLDDDIPF
jgi:hypothetical protein